MGRIGSWCGGLCSHFYSPSLLCVGGAAQDLPLLGLAPTQTRCTLGVFVCVCCIRPFLSFPSALLCLSSHMCSSAPLCLSSSVFSVLHSSVSSASSPCIDCLAFMTLLMCLYDLRSSVFALVSSLIHHASVACIWWCELLFLFLHHSSLI